MMRKLTLPEYYTADVRTLDYQAFYDAGYRVLLFDLDNTLLPWNVYDADEDTIAFGKKLEEMGFKVAIVSNNNGDRVRRIARAMELPYVPKALKPLPMGFKKGVELFGLPKKQVLILGDQFYTDMFGGFFAGITRVYVEPLSASAYGWTNFVHDVEKGLRKKARLRPNRPQK